MCGTSLTSDIGRMLRASVITVALLLFASTSSAEFPLDLTLDGKAAGDFGMVSVTEDGSGGLVFVVSLNPDTLGPRADLHRLYFNLSNVSGMLSGVTDDDYQTPYEVVPEPVVTGGAGSRFDYAVDFGKGASAKGNGTLQVATFRLEASGSALSLSDMMQQSHTRRGTALHVVVHVQSAEHSAIGGAWVEPEPAPSLPDDDDPCAVFTCAPNGL